MVKTFLSLVLLLSVALLSSGDDGWSVRQSSAVVKVFAISSRPNFYQPWQNFQPTSSTGSGTLIRGGLILTNAHIVANQTFLQVRKQGDPKKYVARLEIVGHECDLALLRVDDPAFHRDSVPLELGEMPSLQEKVRVLGYPVGGDNISLTEGVVSRIEPVTYNHSGRNLLAVQIDAAINPGNSGGPVIDRHGKMVGVAFQGLSESQNIGYMIPLPVINHFLEDVKDGKFDGFPNFLFRVMRMENPDLRAWAKMPEALTGVLVTYLPAQEKQRGVLRLNDVIMEIDGIKIANDATVPYRENDVIIFGTLIWQTFIGEKCRMRLWREGREIELDYPLTETEKLVPERAFDILPSYFITGGMLFVPLSINYLDSWREWWTRAPRRLGNHAIFGERDEHVSQIVVLSEVMADEVNVGYQYIKYTAVTRVNGRQVRDLKDFIAKVEAVKRGFLEIELEDDIVIVMDAEKCRAANPRIMERYRVPADRSADLRAAQ